MASDAALPRDPDVLLGLVADLRDENDRLRAMLATLKRMLFGVRSERHGAEIDSGQLPLGLDDVSTVPPEAMPKTAGSLARPDAPARPKPARNIGALPNHLPREDVVIEPAVSECPCCRGKLHRIGEDVSEMLDHCAGDHPGEAHHAAALWLSRLRKCRGAGPRAGAADRGGTAHGGVASACRGRKVCLAPAAASPDADAGRSGRHARPQATAHADRAIVVLRRG